MPLFIELGWMTIEHRIIYHKCLLIFKCLKNEAPSYLTEKVTYVSENNPYQLRNVVNGDLCVPKSRTELFKKSFSYSGPCLWNSLPTSIRTAQSTTVFKYKLKGYCPPTLRRRGTIVMGIVRPSVRPSVCPELVSR